MADTTAINPNTAADDSGIGTEAWVNPSNALTANDSYATVSLIVSADTSHYLKLTNFGFAIPTDSTILGIVATIHRKAGTDSGLTFITDGTLKLVKGGTIQGTDHADTTTHWPTTEASVDYGSSSDLWGLTFTPAQINASDFGVALSAIGGALLANIASVDVITITVYYTPGPSVISGMLIIFN